MVLETCKCNQQTNSQSDVVISGMSGRFPESGDIQEFKDNLFGGIDMVAENDRRWPVGLYGLPRRNGKLKDMSRFDASFFSVNPKMAQVMDPQIRMLQEAAFEAIVDAGVNPDDLKGSNTGVFIGINGLDSREYWTADPENITGYGVIGCTGTMFANRISYALDLHGPSFSIDSGCSASLMGLNEAFNAIKSGVCNAAIVGGVNLLLKPNDSLHFLRLGILCPNGKCRSFDEKGVGYVRSEAVAVVFLQKACDAKRIYATVLNIGSNCDGYKEEGITFPSGKLQGQLIQSVSQQIGMKPEDVRYVEAHGTGTKVGDPQEVNAIAKAFCVNRSKPLLLGAVKSNMGHGEAASGVCSLIKVLLAMEEHKIPANLNFSKPNPDIPALLDGRIQVVNKNQEWNGGIAAINSFGFGGANVHTLLKSNTKEKSAPTKSDIPRLVCLTGRTHEAVEYFLKKLEESPLDDDMLSLIYSVFHKHIAGHPFRGYTVLGGGQIINDIVNEQRQLQVWYVFPGMGTQWVGMGRAYMCLEPFSAAIHKCAAVLAQEGIDLLGLINQSNEETFENLINCFVTIISIQVALVDLLSALGISPQGIIGHSAGELSCAYADGVFTAEQTVLAAYWRGRCVIDSKPKEGAMAAVALTWEQAKTKCPRGIFLACHNGPDSVTISGPASEVKAFVTELQAEGIFTRIVKSNGIAFHSQLIANAAPKFRANLEKIIPNPKPRTKRWLSSSIPENGWASKLAADSSAAYHTNNFLSPVLFDEVVSKIPEDAVVLEIAPHCLLQSIVKARISENSMYVGLCSKSIPDQLGNFMANIGKLYVAGCTPNLKVFHSFENFPVPRGTPMLAPLIQWDHSVEWDCPDFSGKNTNKTGETTFKVNISSEQDSFIVGHTIDGRVLFPAAGYLALIWKAFAKLHQKPLEETAVVIRDASFLRATIMPKDGAVKFNVNILDATGNFEISEGGSPTMTGQISFSEGISEDGIKNLETPPLQNNSILNLDKTEVYRDLKLRGYDYQGLFRGIKRTNNSGTNGILDWNENWISFIDTMLQMYLVGLNTRHLFVPVRILQVIIDPQTHLKAITKNEIPVHVYPNFELVHSGGIEIRNMTKTLAPAKAKIQTQPKLEQYAFVPYFIEKEIPWHDALTTALQIVFENSGERMKIKITEICNDHSTAENILAPEINFILGGEPLVWVEINLALPNGNGFSIDLEKFNGKITKKDIAKGAVDANSHLLVGSGLLSEKNILKNAIASVSQGGFVLCIEGHTNCPKLQELKAIDETIEIISKLSTNRGILFLLRKTVHWTMPKIINITQSDFGWIDKIKEAMKLSVASGQKFILLSDKQPETGIMGLFNCIKQEPGGENCRCVFLADPPERKFTLEDHIDHLKKDLLVNIYEANKWGSMRHLAIASQMKEQEVQHAYVNTLTKGDLSSLKWVQGPLSFVRAEDHPDTDLCTVYYSPLNFKDIMLATGKLAADTQPGKLEDIDCVLGVEFVGRDSMGNRVMGIVKSKALATSVLANPRFLWHVPKKWTMEEASTVPVVYATCYLALIVRGRLRRGERILIHAGSGGIGQAAITIALSMDCEVFTTVGTQEKKDFLKRNFPKLKECNIGCSRDTSFEQMILQKTGGHGVDLVLNSLAGDLLQASVRCLADYGRFLEIGKFDLTKNTALGMAVFLKNATVHGIFLDSLLDEPRENIDVVAVHKLLLEGIETGVVQPLPVTTFTHMQLEQAFRFMATGKHIGKVVIKVRDEEQENKATISNKCMLAVPRTFMNPNKSYIILGGLGGFGLELCHWLISRGAKHVVLVSRSGVKTGYQNLCLKRWEELGSNVFISTSDASTLPGSKQLLQEAIAMAPVGGIFNLALVLRDAYIENQSVENFEAVFKAKVLTTKSLDETSKTLCPELDYFVVFSSLACGRGNAGQTNYGMANSSMERICKIRQAQGLPGTAIQWGAIGDVGILMDQLKGDKDTIVGGTLPQPISSCMAALDRFLQAPYSVVSSMIPAESNRKAKETNEVNLLSAVGNILGAKNIEKIQGSSSLADLGMDSLMSAEIKNTLERAFDLVLSPGEIRSLTFNQLRELSSEANQEAEKGEVKKDK